jgi:hypothetical protein
MPIFADGFFELIFLHKDCADNISVQTVNLVQSDIAELVVDNQDQQTISVPVDLNGI